MSPPPRGLKNLRTLAGKVDHRSVPHKVQMQLACLEIERYRRGVERKSASRRIADLDARLREIDVEIAALGQGLATREIRKEEGGNGIGTRPSSRRNAGGFQFRY